MLKFSFFENIIFGFRASTVCGSADPLSSWVPAGSYKKSLPPSWANDLECKSAMYIFLDVLRFEKARPKMVWITPSFTSWLVG